MHVRSASLDKAGDFFVIKLPRLNPVTGAKVSTVFPFPKEIKIGHRNYRCVAKVAHEGDVASQGHFVFAVGSTVLNDLNVIQGKNNHDVPTANDYMLLYKCQGTTASVSGQSPVSHPVADPKPTPKPAQNPKPDPKRQKPNPPTRDKTKSKSKEPEPARPAAPPVGVSEVIVVGKSHVPLPKPKVPTCVKNPERRGAKQGINVEAAATRRQKMAINTRATNRHGELEAKRRAKSAAPQRTQ